MKDLKNTLGSEMYSGFSEISQNLMVYKNYVENLSGKPKDQSVREFVKAQMKRVRLITNSLLDSLDNCLDESIEEWENKNKEDET